MKTYKRETTRQGLIRDCAIELARQFPHSSESNYRQNVHTVINNTNFGTKNLGRIGYLASLSEHGYKLLYTTIAKRAVYEDKRLNPTFPMNVEHNETLSAVKWARFWGYSD